MNRSFLSAIISLLILCRPLAGQAAALDERNAQQPEAPRAFPGQFVTVDELRKDVAAMAHPDLKGRGLLSDRRRAADSLEKTYKDLGLLPLFPDGYRQKIPAPSLPGSSAPLLGENVGALLEGSDGELRDEFIVLAAHYDHLGVRGDGQIYRGADDNGAGVAMLLAVARAMVRADCRPKRSVLFVNFDLEENLLWGSRWFVEHSPVSLQQIRLFITADLIGRNLMDLDWPALFVMGGERGDSLPALLRAIPTAGNLEVRSLGADIVGTRSDYGPFRDHEVPFLFFSSGQHRDYHTPRDVPERVDYEKLRLVTLYIGETLLRSADSNRTAEWVEKPEPNLEEVRTLLRITQVLEEQPAVVRLEPREKLFVSRFRQKLEAIHKQGNYSRKERSEVTRSAQQLLMILFIQSMED